MHKFFICFFCLIISNFIQAEDWQGYWVKAVENCENIAGAGWCGKVFKTLKCQTACGWAVYEIQQGCFWCCEGEGFYKRCIKPFEDIGKYIQTPCDPMWD